MTLIERYERHRKNYTKAISKTNHRIRYQRLKKGTFEFTLFVKRTSSEIGGSDLFSDLFCHEIMYDDK